MRDTLHSVDLDVTADIWDWIDEQIRNENETGRPYDVPRCDESLRPIAPL